jgi:uncharacterized protein YbcV (DUF1398 family)
MRRMAKAVENLQAALQRAREDGPGSGDFAYLAETLRSAGVTSYEVDFIGRTVTYRGAGGESCVETYPAAELRRPAVQQDSPGDRA